MAAMSIATQLIEGDSTDNIPGLPGVGPVTAKKLLKGLNTREELHNCVKKEYNKRKLDSMFEEVLTLCKLLTK